MLELCYVCTQLSLLQLLMWASYGQTHCLRLFVVVYKLILRCVVSNVLHGLLAFIVTSVDKSLLWVCLQIYCLRLFVVVV